MPFITQGGSLNFDDKEESFSIEEQLKQEENESSSFSTDYGEPVDDMEEAVRRIDPDAFHNESDGEFYPRKFRKFKHYWEPIKYTKLKVEPKILIDNVTQQERIETMEEAKTRAGKRLNALFLEGKTGINFSFTTGTERHDVGVGRLLHILKHNSICREAGYTNIKKWGIAGNQRPETACHSTAEWERFCRLDNSKKWLYKFDVYLYRWRNQKKKELLANISRTGVLHIKRIILEVDGGYHRKWRQMVKDDWRDKDTLAIFHNATIIRFDVDELVPENLNPNKDATSIDDDIARKILYNRNFHSIDKEHIDTVGKPIVPRYTTTGARTFTHI